MSSNNISEMIRQAIISENYRYEKVINDAANGFKRAGFFTNPEWKNLLVHGFERKNLKIDIQFNTTVHTSMISDTSVLDGFVAQSTPLVVGRTGQKETQMPRKKRTLAEDGRQRDTPKTFKKARSSVDEIEAAKILIDLQKTDWARILPRVNEKQNAVPFVNVFEKSRQHRLGTPLRNKLADSGTVSQPTSSQPTSSQPTSSQPTSSQPTSSQPTSSQPTSSRDQNRPTVTNTIRMRRNSIYPPKRPTDREPVAQQSVIAPATKVVSNGSKKATLAPTDLASDGKLNNITNRRLTRKQSQLLAAYTGSPSNNISKRRNTGVCQRTSVIFTMVDATTYENILQKYNIFVADTNEQYDYVITKRICRSPKFLSAVVSGKPILSTEWLHALDEKKIWLDPLAYLLKDDDGEKKFACTLSETFLKANNKRLLEHYSILVTTHASHESLKDVIFSGGGKFLRTSLVPRKGDEVICISDEMDRKTWGTLHGKYPTLKKIISLDGFSKMILQYTHEVSSAHILHQF